MASPVDPEDARAHLDPDETAQGYVADLPWRALRQFDIIERPLHVFDGDPLAGGRKGQERQHRGRTFEVQLKFCGSSQGKEDLALVGEPEDPHPALHGPKR